VNSDRAHRVVNSHLLDNGEPTHTRMPETMPINTASPGRDKRARSGDGYEAGGMPLQTIETSGAPAFLTM